MSLSVKESISLIKDIIVGVSALGTMVIAFLGLKTWRKEIKGKSEYNLAKDLLREYIKILQLSDRLSIFTIPNLNSFVYEGLDRRGKIKEEKSMEFSPLSHYLILEEIEKSRFILEGLELEARNEWKDFHFTISLDIKIFILDMRIIFGNAIDNQEEEIKKRSIHDNVYYLPIIKDENFLPLLRDLKKSTEAFEKYLRDIID